jgi:hypothetical protein
MKRTLRSTSPSALLFLFGSIACASLGGCAEDALEADLSAEQVDIASATQEIRDGVYAGFQKGLLEIKSPRTVCTAAMISPTFAVTAASCLELSSGARELAFPMTVTYFDPDTQTRRPVSRPDEVMYAWAIPTWDGVDDYQDNLALIRRNEPWLETDPSDYLRLNGGTRSGSVDDIYPMSLFGRGTLGNQGGGEGTLRSAPVRLAGSDKHHMHDLEGSRAVCPGDMGGPWIGTTAGLPVVAGVTTAWEIRGNLKCTASGAKQHAARINSRIDWILSKMPPGACTKYDHYTQCF